MFKTKSYKWIIVKFATSHHLPNIRAALFVTLNKVHTSIVL